MDGSKEVIIITFQLFTTIELILQPQKEKGHHLDATSKRPQFRTHEITELMP